MDIILGLLIKLMDKFFPVFTLIVGAFISFIGTLYLSNQAYKRKLKEDTEKRERKDFITPITDYIDELLSLASRTTWLHRKGPVANIDLEIVNKVTSDKLKILCRINSLSNENILTTFNELFDMVLALSTKFKTIKPEDRKELLTSIQKKASILYKELLT